MYIIIYIHHCSIIQNGVTALKILWAPPIHPRFFFFFIIMYLPSHLKANHLVAPKQKLNFKFWLGPASRKAVFTSKETEAVFVYQPVIQVHKSICLYTKTSRMVLFIHRGKSRFCVFEMFWRPQIFIAWPTFGVLACLSTSGQPGQALNQSLHMNGSAQGFSWGWAMTGMQWIQ